MTQDTLQEIMAQLESLAVENRPELSSLTDPEKAALTSEARNLLLNPAFNSAYKIVFESLIKRMTKTAPTDTAKLADTAQQIKALETIAMKLAYLAKSL